MNGHVEVVDKLLQHGARVDLQEKVIICVNLRHCTLPSHAEFSKDGFVFSNLPYTVQCS